MQNTTIHQLDVIIPHSQGKGTKTGTKTGEKGKTPPKYSACGYFLANVEEAHLQCKRCVGKVQCEQQHLSILTRSVISVRIVLKQSIGPQLCLKAINWSSIGLIINPRRSIWIQSWNQDWKMTVYIPRKFSRETQTKTVWAERHNANPCKAVAWPNCKFIICKCNSDRRIQTGMFSRTKLICLWSCRQIKMDSTKWCTKSHRLDSCCQKSNIF